MKHTPNEPSSATTTISTSSWSFKPPSNFQSTDDILRSVNDENVTKKPRPAAPEHGANVLSKATFHWIHSLLRKGFKQPLLASDIPLISPDRSVDTRLATIVQLEFEKNIKRGDKFPLWWALYNVHKFEFWLGGACRGLADVLLVTTPYTLRYLIQFAIDSYGAHQQGASGPPISHGIAFLVGISAMLFLQTLAHNQFMYLLGVIGGQSRAVLVSSIFDKSMRTRGRGESGKQDKEKKSAATDYTIGRLTNLMSVDCTRIDRATTGIHMLWTAPLSLCIAISLLIFNLRESALAGLGLMVVGFILLITAVGVLFQKRKGIDKVTETRVTLIQEVLGAVQLVKYLAWEDGFVQRIAGMRNQETRRLHGFQAVRNIVAAISQSLPVMTAMVSFITYAKISNEGLSPAVVFSSVALFTSLRMPLIYLPLCIQGCIDSWSALVRVQKFLLTDEPDHHPHDPDYGYAVDIRDASFVWPKTFDASKEKAGDGVEIAVPLPVHEDGDEIALAKSGFSLENINLKIGRGRLIAIIGPVGSGKTSILSAMMGEMTMTSGKVVWGSKYAICAQQAWVYNATVKENILFGQPLDGDRYLQVLRFCSLERDLDLLTHGDATMVGEKGVVLSGGQKQRISLARGLYSRAEVLLLDDPLSAVDAHVGRDILEKGICGDLAAGRTRVLCTHDTRLLQRCDGVLWMDQGRIRGLDHYENLMAYEPDFASLVKRQEEAAKSSAAEHEAAHASSTESQPPEIRLKITTALANPEEAQSHEAKKEEKPDDIDNTLMQEEDRAVQSVPWKVYSSFIKWSNSAFLVTSCIPVLFLAQGSTVLTSLWLAWWSSQRFSTLTTNQYIAIYASLAVGQAIFTYLFGFILAVCCTRSSQRMLHQAVNSVLHAPMSFFDTTPLGRHTNRFSTDVEVTDYSLTEALRMFLTSLSGLTAIFVVIIVYFNWFAIAVVCLLAFLTFLASYYRATAREVKRWESIFRSVVFVRFIEGLKGASTIRTFGMDHEFGRKLRCALDDVNSALFTTYGVQRWLGLRQDVAATLLVVIMGILVLVERYDQHPSISGLVLSLMLNAVQVTQVVVREWADVEGSMNAVERLYTYAVDLPQEGLDDENKFVAGPAKALGPQTWLQKGEVIFDNVRLRYRPGLAESLRGVNLHIKPGEHVAIVGRTGAGKSSMVNALFRTTELSGGSITIDAKDIASLRLQDLRRALSIIPQDADLFSGTVRSNLDPFDDLPDDTQLWDALRAAAGLNQSLALSDTIRHDGSNLSQGQRQLLALARVLVRQDNRVLVCDEATAALDGDTDDRIQEVMRTAFRGRTIICIAHRLRTVLWYDRVCVMDAGEVAELASPLELFRREDGIFRGMCVRHGITEDQIEQSARLGKENID
ncbi:ABC transporter family protein [Apiospora arundinis]